MCIVERKYKETIEYYKVYSALIYAAKDQKKLNYTDIAKIMNLPETGQHMGAETGHLLCEISENEHNNERPLLGAVVVKSNMGIPGDGFFTFACQLHKLKENATPEQKKLFWKNELNQVYEKWSD